MIETVLIGWPEAGLEWAGWQNNKWDLPAWQFWLITIVVCNVAAAITEDCFLHLMYLASDALDTEYEWGERRFFLRKHEQTRQGLVPRQIPKLLTSPLVLLERLHGPAEGAAMSAVSACGFLLRGGLAFVSGVLDRRCRVVHSLATAFHCVGRAALLILGIIWWPVRFAYWLADAGNRCAAAACGCCHEMGACLQRRRQRQRAERKQAAAAEAERRGAEQKVLEAQQATEKAKREEEERRAAERQRTARVGREAREAREEQEWARLQAAAQKNKNEIQRQAEKQKQEEEEEEKQDDYTDLRLFLAEQKLTKLTEKLVENEVTFDCLLHLEEADLEELGVAKGPRVKLLRTMQSYAAAKPVAAPAPARRRASTSTGSGEPPDEFCCPITQELMVDPVLVVASGQTYERTEM